ncbi:macro domain-containing protein [Lysobacter gummosus]|uniref:Macro domain-containing protein n=1 Tax=Lysobacter gummosus TaxID=262324 RepID=A0ABY3XCN7_9GAMM|nr:macro domain-containing protein [Lysobacter gummosus]UNP29291.1 macro domain-containing protein [Lysobacter gummosus]
MPLSLEIGDIFSTPDVIAFAHGCNCAGAMGKGIAVSFRRHWPAMYQEYRRRCAVGEFKLGDVFLWEQENISIFNLGTQQSWRTKAEYWAVKKSLSEMVRLAEDRKVREIVLPRIGAGLGDLEWQDIQATLQSLGDMTSVLLRVCDIFVSGQPLTKLR